jgi:hypothetical protein
MRLIGFPGARLFDLAGASEGPIPPTQAFRPAYRLRIMAPRSVDPTEATVLTDATAGPAQFATTAGVAGYEPVLDFPGGRRSSFDLLNRKVEGGTVTFELLDRRLTAGGSNATRLVSRFLGDTNGAPRLLGCKVEVDFCPDRDAPAWERWFTGRIQDVELVGKTRLALAVDDMANELKAPIFGGPPHASVTYAAGVVVVPEGVPVRYGVYRPTARLTGTVQAGIATAERTLIVTSDVQYNEVTAALEEGDVPLFNNAPGAGELYQSTSLRLRCTFTSGALVGQTREYAVLGILRRVATQQFSTRRLMAAVYFSQLSGGAGLPAATDACTWQIIRKGAPPSAKGPLVIGDVHVVQYLADLLDGKFSTLKADGSIARSWPRDAASFAALLADTSIGYVRRLVQKESDLQEELESVCRQFGLGYRLDEFGRVVLFDVRLPSTLAGVPLLTEADLDEGKGGLAWRVTRDRAITAFRVTYYQDRAATLEERASGAAYLIPEKRTVLAVDFGRSELGDREYTLDANGVRVTPNELARGTSLLDFAPAILAARSHILKLIEQFRSAFGAGPQDLTLVCRRTATVTALREGALFLLSVPWLPNVGTNARGGTRLFRLLEWNDDGPRRRFRAIDMGANVSLATPALANVRQQAANPQNAVEVDLTLNGSSDVARVEFAVTTTAVATLGAVPAEAWVTYALCTTSQTLTILPVGAGRRVWVRARSERAQANDVPRLPSAWVSPTPAYVDTAALATPTGVAVTRNTTLRATLGWTVGSPTHELEVWIAAPSTDPLALAAVLPEGTTTFDVLGTEPGVTYRATVRHRDGAGGFSAFAAETSWTASNTPAQAPALLGMGAVTGIE